LLDRLKSHWRGCLSIQKSFVDLSF
jgi:hypothetical protein